MDFDVFSWDMRVLSPPTLLSLAVVSLASLAAETSALSMSTSPDPVFRRRDVLTRATAGLAGGSLLVPLSSPGAASAREVTDASSGELPELPPAAAKSECHRLCVSLSCTPPL